MSAEELFFDVNRQQNISNGLHFILSYKLEAAREKGKLIQQAYNEVIEETKVANWEIKSATEEIERLEGNNIDNQNAVEEAEGMLNDLRSQITEHSNLLESIIPVLEKQEGIHPERPRV